MCSFTHFNRIGQKNNFQEYWKHEWEAKKIFVRFLTKKVKAARARDRKDKTSSRRKWSHNYYLKKDKSIVRVCKTMFLNTLSKGEWTALNWQKNEGRRLSSTVYLRSSHTTARKIHLRCIQNQNGTPKGSYICFT